MSHMKRMAGDEVKAEPRRRKGMQNSAPDPDQEAKARRQAQLEQRHLETYRNMHRLRDALYRRYAALLKNKVQSQRLLLQQRHQISTAKSATDTKQKQKKLAFSKLQHDDSYLTSLPKSSYYLIFDLQKQLAERGHLKTHYDLEDFYRCIKYNDSPSQLERSLQDVRKKMLENETTEKHPCPAEERGHEDLIWHSRLLEQVSGSGDISAKLNFNGSLETEETEQMFPKVLPGIDSKQGKRSQSNQPPLSFPKLPRGVQKNRPIFPQQLSRMTSASQQHFETLALNTAPCSLKTPDPLSIEDVCQQKHVVIIDRGYELWRNYAYNTDH